MTMGLRWLPSGQSPVNSIGSSLTGTYPVPWSPAETSAPGWATSLIQLRSTQLSSTGCHVLAWQRIDQRQTMFLMLKGGSGERWRQPAVMPNREVSAPRRAEVMRWVCSGKVRSLPGGTEQAPWVVQNLRDIMDTQDFCSEKSRFESEARAEFCVSISGSLRTSALRLYASWWLICYQMYSGFF